MSSITLVTLSFRGDFDLCRLLCESVDTFVPSDIQHIVAVPRSDLEIFSTLKNDRRTLVCQEDLLPKWLWKIPLPSPAWRKRLFLPRRNIYLALGGFFVRGWIAQQLMKISLASRIANDIVLMVDSDAVFVRPLDVTALHQGDKVRLQRFPGAADFPMQRRWHDAASKLLGLPVQGYHGASYMDHLICWRPATVNRMLERIETTGGKDWAKILASTPEFSEYNLYGIFCEKVLGLEEAGHFGSATDMCLSIWLKNQSGGEGAEQEISNELNRKLSGGHYAFAVQSTVSIPLDARRRLFVMASELAAVSDEGLKRAL